MPGLIAIAFSPLNFHNLENRVIKKTLEKTKINGEPSVEWKGFHGFRLGLASNLFSLGVNPKVIAALLRHSDVATTLQYYISVPESARRALQWRSSNQDGRIRLLRV